MAYKQIYQKLQLKIPRLLKKREAALKNGSNYFVPGPLFDTEVFKEIMGVNYDDYLSYTSSDCDLADFSSDDESRCVSPTLFQVYFSVHLLFSSSQNYGYN